jgi:hypothetical protein
MKITPGLTNAFAFALLLASSLVNGDELLHFDNPSVVATLRSGGRIAAYYVGHSDEPYLFARGEFIAVCEFLMYGNKQRNGDYAIKGWEPSLVPAAESRVAPGTIYVGYDQENEWVIQFTGSPPYGCRSKKDGEKFLWRDASFFLEQNMTVQYMNEQGLHVRIVRRVPAIGIRIVHSDTAQVFPTATPTASTKPSFSISLGDVVASIRQKKEYSSIEYIVPATGEKLSGWVRTKYLKDPFTK